MNEIEISEPSASTLDRLEAQSVHILREAYREFKSLVTLWSIGKDSTVLLWLTRKAFFGHVPFPLLHIDTAFKNPEMIRNVAAGIRTRKTAAASRRCAAADTCEPRAATFALDTSCGR